MSAITALIIFNSLLLNIHVNGDTCNLQSTRRTTREVRNDEGYTVPVDIGTYGTTETENKSGLEENVAEARSASNEKDNETDLKVTTENHSVSPYNLSEDISVEKTVETVGVENKSSVEEKEEEISDFRKSLEETNDRSVDTAVETEQDSNLKNSKNIEEQDSESKTSEVNLETDSKEKNGKVLDVDNKQVSQEENKNDDHSEERYDDYYDTPSDSRRMLSHYPLLTDFPDVILDTKTRNGKTTSSTDESTENSFARVGEYVLHGNDNSLPALPHGLPFLHQPGLISYPQAILSVQTAAPVLLNRVLQDDYIQQKPSNQASPYYAKAPQFRYVDEVNTMDRVANSYPYAPMIPSVINSYPHHNALSPFGNIFAKLAQASQNTYHSRESGERILGYNLRPRRNIRVQ